jgi:hypothetical protein
MSSTKRLISPYLYLSRSMARKGYGKYSDHKKAAEKRCALLEAQPQRLASDASTATNRAGKRKVVSDY